MKKKFFVILMSLALTITMMPLSVFADTNAEAEEGFVTAQTEETTTSVQADKNTPFCLTSVGGNVTVKMKLHNIESTTYPFSLEYAYDPEAATWEAFDFNAGVNIKPGVPVYFKNAADDYYAHYPGWYSPQHSGLVGYGFVMESSDPGASVEADGNVMSLAYAHDFAEQDEVESKGAFFDLFYQCSLLTKAPLLPATKICDSCYASMFYDCTSLVEAPALPAKTMEPQCYLTMFRNCKSLVDTPSILSTKLAPACYFGMFYGCSALTNLSKLPATKLEQNCYYCMFCDCVSLENLPQLPATTAAEGCYSFMFANCSSIVAPPKMSVNKVASDCFTGMFADCIKLTSAPELPAYIIASGCYSQMFENCTSLAKAPELPATTMEEDCYRAMFKGCKKLIDTPELRATTLAQGCYVEMFRGCDQLQTATILHAHNLVENCYNFMFDSCSSLTNLTAYFEYDSEKPDVFYEDSLLGWLPDNSGSLYCVPSWKGHENLLELPTGWKVTYIERETTPLGNTGLSLIGNRKAVENIDYKLYDTEGKQSVDICTTDWELEGNGPDVDVYFVADEDNAILEMGDVNICFFENWTNTASTIKVNGEVNIGDEDTRGEIALYNDLTITGNGSLNIPNGGIIPYTLFFVSNVTLDIAKIHITEQENSNVGYPIWAGDLNIKSGQVILESKAQSREGYDYGAIVNAENLNISDDAEVFISGSKAAIVAPKSTLDSSKFLGSDENLFFDRKDQVNSPVQVDNIVFQGSDHDTLSVVGSGSPAKTVYHPGTHPEPGIFDVTFKYQDGTTEDLVKEVVEGEKVARPEDPVREGYTFEGWYDNPEGEGSSYDFDSPVLSDIILYAKWTGVTPGPTPPTPPVNPEVNPGEGGINTGDSTVAPICFLALGLIVGASAILLGIRSRKSE